MVRKADEPAYSSEHLHWVERPVLRRPTMIVAFTGWNDAADAASNGLRQLIAAWNARPLAEIDPEEFTDFATVRPHVRLGAGRTRTIIWPAVGLWSASMPGGDVILVLGPEPALRWRLFCEQIVSVADYYDVSMMISLGALLADVPHTRPVRVIGSSTQPDTRDRFELRPSNYQGPTGIVGALQESFTRLGTRTASLWAAVPAYAAQIPSPVASLALLQRVAAMVGSPPPTASLHDDANKYEVEVNELIEDDADLVTYVGRLESLYDEGALDEDLAEDDDDFAFDDDDDDDQGDDDEVELTEEELDPFSLSDESPAVDPDQLQLDLGEWVSEVEQYLRDQDG